MRGLLLGGVLKLPASALERGVALHSAGRAAISYALGEMRRSATPRSILQHARALACLAIPARAVLPLTDPTNAGSWHLVETMSSEFRDSRLEDGKFFDYLPLQFFDNGEVQKDLQHTPGSLFMPENVRVADGLLHLCVRQDRPSLAGLKAEYSLPAVCTRRLIRNGYFEMKATVLKAAFDSAFWLNKQHVSVRQPLASPWQLLPYQAGNEIDITEICGNSRQDGIDYSRRNNLNCLIYADLQSPPTGVAQDHSDRHSEFDLPNTVPDFTAAPHVFGLEWDDERLQWYVDGQLRRTTTKAEYRQLLAIYSAPGDPPLHTLHRFNGTRFANHVFNLPLQVMLTVDYTPRWHGPPQAEDLPAETTVDYLRVWQKLGTGPELIRNGGLAGPAHWKFTTHDSARASFDCTSPWARLRIQEAGPNAESIQLGQVGLPLQSATHYSLAYEAAATRPHWFQVQIKSAAGTVITQYREFIPQDGTLDHGHSALYSHHFLTPPTAVGKSMITFSCGGLDDPGDPQSARTIQLTSVSLRALSQL